MSVRMTVDFSAHLITQRVAKEIQQSTRKYGFKVPVPSNNWNLEKRLRIMDKYGIDMQALSLTPTPLSGLPADKVMEICKDTNDAIAHFCDKRPDRFVGIAAVSLLDVEGALEELERGIENLGFRGVIVATNQDGKGLDAPEYEPFYERVSKYDVPILLHPVHWKTYPLVDNQMMTIFGWPFDTTQAVWRMVNSGVFDRFKSLKVVTHHLGGMIPYFFGRVKSYTEESQQWKLVYGDTAIDGFFGSFMCGYSFFGSDRMVFGTDYPFGREGGEAFIRENLAGVRAMPITEEEKVKILSDNARKLLKIN